MKCIAFVAVLAFAVSCQAATNCHWGPSYWCQSETTAKECGGTQYCRENVWKKPSPTVGVGGIECEICTMVLNFIEEQGLNNATEDKVKQALESFCNSTGPLSSVCEAFIDENFDQIWELLKDEVDPNKICSMIGLCTSQAPKEVPRLLKKTQANAVGCEICKVVAKEILNLVDSNTTKTDAKVEIKKVCVYLGGFASECRVLIDSFFDELWDAAVSAVGDPSVLCQKINLCSSKVTRTTLKAKISQPMADICDICKLVANFVKPYVDSDSTKDEVKSILDSACALLPGNTSSQCSDLVDTSFPLIWDLLKQEVDSGQVCELIQICKNSTTALKAKPRPQTLPQDTACDVCKLVVSYIKPYVDSNTTEQEIKDALNTVCGFLPSGIKDECTDFVTENFDTVWKMLQNEVDTGKICTDLSLCTNMTKVFVKRPEVSEGACDACKMVVGYLKDIVDNNGTESMAKAAVEALCDKAGPLKDECDALVDQYFPMIWMLLQSYVDDDQICSEIKMCNSSGLVQPPPSAVIQVQSAKSNVGGGVFCVVCEFVMKELTSMLDGNTTKQAVEDALDKVCSELPSSISTDCTQFVNKYAPEIIELILSGTAGKAVCTALGLCVLQDKEVLTEQGTEECAICVTVLELVKSLVSSKSTEAEVSKVLEDVCDVVPSGIKGECKTFIETFGPQLIELLLKAISPSTICREIKLCASNVRLQDMHARKY